MKKKMGDEFNKWFDVGDEVKWFDDRYSLCPNYGTIIRLNKKTAAIKQQINQFETANVRVEYNKLNFD